METIYSPELKAHLTLNDDKRVRQILHTEYFPSEASNARLAAIDYLRQVARTLGIPVTQLEHLHQQVTFLNPHEQGIEYRMYEVKKFFSSSTYCYYQTIHNTPVWGGGLTVDVKENPLRVVAADHRGHTDLGGQLPPQDIIERVRAELLRINGGPRDVTGVRERVAGRSRPATSLSKLFGAAAPEAATKRQRAQDGGWWSDVRIKRGLFYIYRYNARDRQPMGGGVDVNESKDQPINFEAGDDEITLPLPPVPDAIEDGRYYLVVELVFQVGHLPKDQLNWKALVDVATGAILWLRAMIAGVNGLVFTYDPKTSTGDLTNTADAGNAVLNPLRDDEPLPNLNAPVAGTQSLTGLNVTIVDDDSPTVAAPTKPAMTNFEFEARTNDFAAVNAYYHANKVFDVIEDLGFNLADYFDGTAFPVHVDHRASTSTMAGATGIEINAFCMGDGPTGLTGDGIGLVGYCLSDDTGVDDTTIHPLGRSVDKWVHWHEIGGHGILWDHVNSANFGFAHSAGDSLAAFQNDPESLLRSMPERFQYAPFRTWPVGADRWFNRTVAAGWGWGGVKDTGGYNTEQIIATTLFRVYQALGGDANEVAKRWHASRVATYLLLNAVGKLSPGANANSATDLHNKLAAADADDWTSEGLAGGAYKKVIRWSFEKQNLWSGVPPAVDLYIDDGRGGEYQYQAVHWNNPSVWNRTAADGMAGQQPGVAGVESYAYAKVKNRGTMNASGTVKVYHCLPGAGLTWPTDFVQAGPAAGLPTGNVLANSGNEVTVGPFAWTPNPNAYGHDCLIAIVETAQDPSNVNNLGPGETIQEWRLVPHDNNVGQRNVTLVPGGGGGEALTAALDGAFFLAGNTLNKSARMELRVDMPKVLAAKGWALQFAGIAGNTFSLRVGEKRRIELNLSPGADFTADDIRGTDDRTIAVQLYGNDMLIGGMSYHVDPDLIEPASGKGGRDARCNQAAQGLLDCLHVGGGQKVRRVCVKRISVEIEFNNDCGCD